MGIAIHPLFFLIIAQWNNITSLNVHTKDHTQLNRLFFWVWNKFTETQQKIEHLGALHHNFGS